MLELPDDEPVPFSSQDIAAVVHPTAALAADDNVVPLWRAAVTAELDTEAEKEAAVVGRVRECATVVVWGRVAVVVCGRVAVVVGMKAQSAEQAPPGGSHSSPLLTWPSPQNGSERFCQVT